MRRVLLVLVLGGYSLAFCARAGGSGGVMMAVQRYHLFPMLGLVLLPALLRVFLASRATNASQVAPHTI